MTGPLRRGLVRALLVAAVLVPLLAGCASSPPGHFTVIAVEFHNNGTSTMPAELTIKGPDGATLVSTTVQVPGGQTVRVPTTATAASDGTYYLSASYEKSVVSAGSSQHASGSRSHSLQWTDCATATVVVRFDFTYSQSSGGQNFNAGTSVGRCEPAAT